MGNCFKDKILICVDCKEEFAFTIGAQEYFAERGFTEAPKRCRTCYADYKRKSKPRNGVKPPSGLPLDVELEEYPFRFPDSDSMESGNGNRSNIE